MRRLVIGFLCCFFSHINAEKSFPSFSRPERAKFVRQFIKEDQIGAEIGVCNGVFAWHVLLQKKPKQLFLIDPWGPGINFEKQEVLDKQYEKVAHLFAPYERVSILRMRSENAVHLFDDEYFDYVYIDGEHSYEAVKRDLQNYLPKIKCGGYLIGDDLGWEGVRPAVEEFVHNYSDLCSFIGEDAGQYVIRKKF